MRNLRLFIIKNYFFFLFLVFELMAISMYVSYNDHQRSAFMNSSSAFVGYIMETKAEWTEYWHLKDANEQLMTENATLLGYMPESYFEKNKGTMHFKDSNQLLQYTYMPAKVINVSTNTMDNFATLNRGSEDGIAPGMGVINGVSVVGFVKDVSAHYSTVVLVLNKKFTLSVMLRNSKEHGLIQWEGNNAREVLLTGVPMDATVNPGDTVVTRGASARFPENILVGRVKEVQQKPGSMHHHIIVELSTNFNALYHVYVVDNHFKQEQLELEQKLIEEKEK
jgi:rod shape-determining protein MreC